MHNHHKNTNHIISLSVNNNNNNDNDNNHIILKNVYIFNIKTVLSANKIEAGKKERGGLYTVNNYIFRAFSI